MRTHRASGSLRPSDPFKPLKQAGVSLFVALIALVGLGLAAVALVRTVDTDALVIGNLGFKKAATSVADQAAEVAIVWLTNNAVPATLYYIQENAGYYPAAYNALDPTGTETVADGDTHVLVDWEGDDCASAESSHTACLAPVRNAAQSNGYAAHYVITRMCAVPGDPNGIGNSCLTPLSTSSSSPKRGGLDYSDYARFVNEGLPYFRVIVRVDGPRNTVSYTETMVHF